MFNSVNRSALLMKGRLDSLHLVPHRREGHQHTLFCCLRWPKFQPKSATKKCSSLKAIVMHGWRAVNSHLPFLPMPKGRLGSLHLVWHRREGHLLIVGTVNFLPEILKMLTLVLFLGLACVLTNSFIIQFPVYIDQCKYFI